MERIELNIPPRVAYLSMVRAVVAAAAQKNHGVAQSKVDDLRLIVSEATTNAIEAHHRAGIDTPISITCEVKPGQIGVWVKDCGTGFDPHKLVAHPPVTDPERLEFERGLGIPLMRRLADEHEIQPSASGTTVRLLMRTPAIGA